MSEPRLFEVGGSPERKVGESPGGSESSMSSRGGRVFPVSFT